VSLSRIASRFLFLDAVTDQVAAEATTAETPPATSAGARLGLNGAGPEYSMPTGLVQTTGDVASSLLVESEVNVCEQPHGAIKK
jgi:hypothetical protein